MALSITLGPAAIATGSAPLLGALLTLAFRLVSLRVALELASLLRQVGSGGSLAAYAAHHTKR